MEFLLKLYEIEKIEECRTNEIYSKIKIEETSDIFSITFEDEKPRYENDILEHYYIKIGNIFKEIKLSKIDNSILNIQDLIFKWETLKKEIVFNIEDEMLVNYVFNMTKYYENKVILDFLLSNFNIIPFFKMIDYSKLENNNNKEKILGLFGIFLEEKLEFKIKCEYSKKYNGDEEILFSGEKNPNFDISEIKRNLREKYNITYDKVFNLNLKLSGKYVFNETFQELYVHLVADAGKHFVNECIISITRSDI